MAQSLYRKYRPQRFDDRFVGQDHVRVALRNAVRDGKVGHAYLFSGPRGTGKTTTARLLAKALNCLEPGGDGEPCGTCDNCVAIAEGRFLDLFELDAASNNSVDNIRDLTERVNLGLGRDARAKVYIIDEVHMLSGAASNALLKTLEEPPAHVVFVLATTNPEKVLPTIRSRTQHFEFTLLETDDLAAHLRAVVEMEGVALGDEVLEQVARAGAGSARDALSILDQVLATAAGGDVDAAAIAGILGRTGFDGRAAILGAIAEEDVPGVLRELLTLVEAGHDPRRIAEDVLRSARDAFLLAAGAGRVPIDLPGDERDQLTALGAALGYAAMVRIIETLGTAIVDMRGSDAADPRLVLEVALVRLARRDAGPPLEALADRVERLEQALAAQPRVADAPAPAPTDAAPTDAGPTAVAERSGGPRALGALRREAQPAPAPSPEEQGPAPAPPGGGVDEPTPSEAPAAPLAVDDVILAWADLLPALPPATRSAVQEAQPVRVDGDVVVFAIAPHLVAAARPRFKKVADQVREGLGARLGRTMKFTLVDEEVLPDPEADDSGPAAGEEPVDVGELVDADEAGRAVDSLARLKDTFGASVVEERLHE